MDEGLMNDRHEGKDTDIAIAEGSMGLYDGVATKGASGFGSSAETQCGLDGL